MQRYLSWLFSILVGVLVFFTPSNLFFVLDESVGYVNGMRIDYLLPKLQFTDLLLVVTLVVGALAIKKNISFQSIYHKKYFLLLLLLGLLAVAQFYSFSVYLGLITIARLLLLSMLGTLIIKKRELIKQQVVVTSLVITILFQLVVASLQFFSQHSVFPSYQFFGESRLTSSRIGLARGTFGGEERLLAYGTTAHPNVLAGITVLYSLLSCNFFYNKKKYFLSFLTIVVASIFVVLTQSFSAGAALLIGVGIIIFRYKYISFPRFVILITLACIFSAVALLWAEKAYDSLSISRRVSLNSAALAMFGHSPITGVGMGQFTAYIEQFMVNKEMVRFLQPAHNLLLLFLAEAGVIGIGILLTLTSVLKKVLFPVLVVALLPLIALDHYLYTLQSGMIALCLFVALSMVITRSSLEKE